MFYSVVASAIQISPWVVLKRNSAGKVVEADGQMGRIFHMILTSCNASITYVGTDDGKYGQPRDEARNTSSVGMHKMIDDGKADFGVGPIVMVGSTFLQYNAHYVGNSKFLILTGLKQPFMAKPTAIGDAFDLQSWLLLLLSIAVILLLLNAEKTLKQTMGGVKNYLTSSGLILCAILLQESEPRLTSKKLSPVSYILFGVFIVSSFVLTQMFVAETKTNSLILMPTERIDEITQTFKKKDLRLHYLQGSMSQYLLMRVGGETGRNIRNKLSDGLPESAKTIAFEADRIRDSLLSGKGFFFFDLVTLNYIVAKWCKQTKYSFYFAQMQKLSFSQAGGFISSRRLPKVFARKINRQLSWINAYGIGFDLTNERSTDNLRCVVDSSPRTSEDMEQLSLEMIQYLFYLILINSLFAILTFFAEMLVHRYFSKPNR